MSLNKFFISVVASLYCASTQAFFLPRDVSQQVSQGRSSFTKTLPKIDSKITGDKVEEENIFKRYQCWSNPQETIDYMDYLGGRAPIPKIDQPSVVLGAGTEMKEIIMEKTPFPFEGDVFIERWEDIPEKLVDNRGQEWEDFPIYVCLPEWELEEKVLLAMPGSHPKRDDLVFTNENLIEKLLARYGLSRKQTTQMLPYYKLAMNGKVKDPVTTYKVSEFDGDALRACVSVTCGKWGGAVKERFNRIELTMDVVQWPEYKRMAYERGIFNCAFNVISLCHGGKTFREIVDNQFEELDDMTHELCKCMQKAQTAAMSAPQVMDRMHAMGTLQMFENNKGDISNKDLWPYQVGFFRNAAFMFVNNGFSSPAPMLDEYLGFLKDKGLVDWEDVEVKILGNASVQKGTMNHGGGMTVGTSFLQPGTENK